MTSPPSAPDTGKRLTILGHLAELRTRLIRSVLAVVVTTIISLIFYHQIFDILLRPAGSTVFIAIELTEMIGTMFRVCLVSGIILAVPYLDL